MHRHGQRKSDKVTASNYNIMLCLYAFIATIGFSCKNMHCDNGIDVYDDVEAVEKKGAVCQRTTAMN